ncbi:host specificity factor TipJ family phage tail protein [Ectopseudomonas mendocina]|uniref:Host specificity factor TipJ family phage tail protein n=1 Tax=Ectopseudomonas mendocina TaxID=300 RepID=A0ABZ2RA71_ECTME
MISVYPSRMEGEPIERHEIGGPVRLDEWLTSVVGQEISERETQPVNIDVNGVTIADFSITVQPEDDVRIYPNMYAGVGIGTIIYWAAVAISVVMSIYMYMNMPKSGSSATQSQGDDLDMATAKANQPRANQVIRESFGYQRIYPDYIMPPFKRFVNRREQFNCFCVCIGVGKYQLLPNGVKICETPISVFGDDVVYQIHEPGDSVAGDPLAEFWHVVTEVGGTTTGIGLDLASTNSTDSNANISTVMVSGKTLSTVDGQDEFPGSWNVGLVLSVALPQPVVVSTGAGGRSRFSGVFSDLAPFVGMRVSLAGDEDGNYVISAYSPAVAPTPGTGGSPSAVLGSASPTTYNFTSSPAVFTVTFRGVTKTIQLTSNYVNMSGIISSITDQLSGSGLVAQDSSGRIRIVEPSSPYKGGAITSSGLPVSAFGASPTFTVGTASSGGSPGQDAYIELNFESGAPATGMTEGGRRIAFGYRGFQHQITAITPTSITVNRLTDTGSVDAGWTGWANRYLTDEVISTDGAGAANISWVGPFMACPQNEKTDVIEWDLFLPQGIGATDKKGRFYDYRLDVLMQYRDASVGGAWTDVPWTHTGRTADQIGFTMRTELPYAMRPQVRMRRLTAVQQWNMHRDAINWYGLRSRLPAPSKYDDVTVMTMAVRGGDRLSQQSENKVSVECIRVLNDAPTRAIEDAVYYVAHDLGLTVADIDKSAIGAIAQAFWGPRSETYDHQHSVQSAARDVLQGMFAAGMSHLTISDAKISAKREGVQSMPTQVFSPIQFTKELESQLSAISPDDYDGVDVEFLNEETWSIDNVECRMPGQVAALKVEKIKLDGVTGRTRAWRIGMRQLRKHRLQRWSYTAETELDALNCEFIDRIALSEDAVGESQSALIWSVDGDMLELSEPLDWSGIANPRVRVRRHDGSATPLYTPIKVTDTVIRIPDLDFVPITSLEIEPATLLFGDAERIEYPAMVSEITANSDGKCQIVAVEYTDELYVDDNNAPA